MVNLTVRLPEKTRAKQEQGKLSWNLEHCTSEPDFYTTGYSGRSINEIIDKLKMVGIATLVDIRFTPVSRFRPEFSKKNLKGFLETAGINYVHRPDWGVPHDIRAGSSGKQTLAGIWDWYDSNVMPTIIRNVDEFFNSMEHPFVLMCVERDPTECHRHRLFLGLEKLGLTGCDL